MCRFALDCINKLIDVTAELVETLGADTSKLAIRVGLHSGPVTAGVLRGQKGRFQLFGDTVNTASRMESTGMPGRIHVSSATAEELSRKGKSMWLRPREEFVNVKGKGMLQTFWVEIRSGNQTSTTSGQTPPLGSTDDVDNVTHQLTPDPKVTSCDDKIPPPEPSTTKVDTNSMDNDADSIAEDEDLVSLVKSSVLRLTNTQNQPLH